MEEMTEEDTTFSPTIPAPPPLPPPPPLMSPTPATQQNPAQQHQSDTAMAVPGFDVAGTSQGSGRRARFLGVAELEELCNRHNIPLPPPGPG
jgi:hypothetical protein